MIADWYGLSAGVLAGPPALSAPSPMQSDVPRPSVAQGALTCPVCLIDAPDGYCDCCGATVKIDRAAGRTLAGTGPPLRRSPV